MRAILLIIFLTSLVSAIELQCPGKVGLNEEFLCTAKTNKTGPWDLKFELLDGSKSVARIFNEEKNSFQSSFFYLKNFLEKNFPKTFRVKILIEGNLSGKLKLRKKSRTLEKAFQIIVKNETGFKENVKQKNPPRPKKRKKENKKAEKIEPKKKPTEVLVLKEINLNHGQDSPKKELVYESRNSLALKYSPYAFVLFLALTLFFLLRER